MEDFSDLLSYQIKQYLGASYPIDPKLQKLLQAIDKTYRVSETDHVLHHKSAVA